MESLLRIGDAARALGVSTLTVRRWEAAGLVRSLRDARGWRYFNREDIERLRQWRDPNPDGGRKGKER
ncbi:MAG: MerR family transcriptional regulator [Armatimonadota bacterium]|nr:MAG: MerR family transcriptional regulator [Armatimonadota bacterium]